MVSYPYFGALPVEGGVRFRVWAPDADSVVLRREGPDAVFWIVVRLRGAGLVDLSPQIPEARARHAARVLLTTEDPPFAPDPQPPEFDRAGGRLRFDRPGAVVVMIDSRADRERFCQP